MYTRRDIGRMALVAPFVGLALARIDSTVKGVMLGAQSYSFRQLPDISVDGAVNAYKQCGLGYCELWQGHLEPKDSGQAKAWRQTRRSTRSKRRVGSSKPRASSCMR